MSYTASNEGKALKLFIAEKPSLARALAQALPKPLQQQQGYIQASNGDIVTWCVGHLLEQAPPQVYDKKYKQWSLTDLPIIPLQWQLVPKTATKKQLAIIKKLVKRATVIVNTGDVDREGQILVDEVVDYCGATKKQVASALRCLISDLNLSAIKLSLNNLKPNSDYIPLAVSALARARADWLYGLNMTRLCTLQGQKSGYQGVLSIGRVQTPILGLIVDRERAINAFLSKEYYEVIAHLTTEQGERFHGKWLPSEACHPYMDEANRIISKPLALKVITRIHEQSGSIINVSHLTKQQPPPLLFSLSSLQIAAANACGMNAKKVLDVCQQLYEKHKLITYPRSDCRYLPLSHLSNVKSVTAAIATVCDDAKPLLANADLSLKTKVWNDHKVGAHHAIIPTAKQTPTGRLSVEERKIYQLISRQYMAQFYPPFEYINSQIDTNVAGGTFVSKQKTVKNLGWKALFPVAKSNKQPAPLSALPLPDVNEGQQVKCERGELQVKETTAPKRFTDATLLGALTGIARFVTDETIKMALRQTDGLGTEATRAGIIELLFKRDYLVKQGKEIQPTDVAIQLISALPAQISQPDMTAMWESQLESIATKSMTYKTFMNGIEQNLIELIAQVKAISFEGLPTKKSHHAGQRKKKYTRKRQRIKG